MGKTLGSIIGAAVGVVFLSPFIGPGAALAVGASIGGGLAGALESRPQNPQPETASTAIKSSRAPRVSGYGISRLYWAYALYEASDAGRAVDVGAVHDGRMDGVVALYLNDDLVTVDSVGAGPLDGGNVGALADGRYAGGFIQLYWTYGDNPNVAILNVIDQLPSIWTEDHRGDGIVTMALVCSPVKADDFLKVYPNSVPTPSMVSRWQLCPDPFATDPTDESEWTWTENPIRQLMHYKLVREGVDYATKIAPTLSYWQDAADVCDEAVALKAGGTEARYRSWLSHKHTDSHGAVSAAILQCCDGWIAPRSDGALVVFAGKYTTPTVEINSAHIVAYEWQGVGVDDDQAVNELVCSYISADHDYNTVECDAWTDEDDIAERGQLLSDGFERAVPSWGQIRRLAKRHMSRTNALHRGTITTNIAGRIVRGHRYITLTLEEAGSVFYDGPVEITAVTRNIATGGVTFSWVAAEPAIDTWNPATEEGEPAAKGDRVALAPLDTPVILTATPQLYEYGAQIALDVTGPDRTDLTWYTRWRIDGDVAWSEQETSDIDPGTPVALVTPIVPLNVDIEVQAAYGVGDGRTSDWSATETVSTDASGLAPSPVTDVSASGGVGQVSSNWRNPSSANFGYTRTYIGTSASFGSATAMTPDDFGGILESRSATFTGITPATYYVWVRAFNASGTAATPVQAAGTVAVT